MASSKTKTAITALLKPVASSSRHISTTPHLCASEIRAAPLAPPPPKYLEFPKHNPLPQTHGIHVATLHLAAYHPYNLDLYTQFALHSAKSLNIPTSGAAMLPVRQELYTVPKSPFVHKKRQENFERRHHARVIKVFDTDRGVLDLWLRYLKKNGLGGVGMRAKVFEWVEPGFTKREMEGLERGFEGLGEGVGEVQKAAEELIRQLSAEDEDGKAHGLIEGATEDGEGQGGSTAAAVVEEGSQASSASTKPSVVASEIEETAQQFEGLASPTSTPALTSTSKPPKARKNASTSSGSNSKSPKPTNTSSTSKGSTSNLEQPLPLPTQSEAAKQTSAPINIQTSGLGSPSPSDLSSSKPAQDASTPSTDDTSKGETESALTETQPEADDTLGEEGEGGGASVGLVADAKKEVRAEAKMRMEVEKPVEIVEQTGKGGREEE